MRGVQIAQRLRGARREAGLTQAEVARRADTSQPAVAAYESGARQPGFDVFERLMLACGFVVDVTARPAVRRGAQTLAELASRFKAEAATDPQNRRALRSLFGFVDDYLGSTDAGRRFLVRDRPMATGRRELDAALAGLAEYLSARAGVPAPGWASDRALVASPWWFVTDTPALHPYLLAHAPAAIAKHGVFIAAEVFDRV